MASATQQLQSSQAAQDARLEDYLNDKLQTFADFEVLDSLLANIQTQQDLLQKQLQDAQQDLRSSEDAYDTANAANRQKAQAFEKQQRNIDKSLLVVTRSETSDDAVRQFDSAMDQLRRLDMTTEYLGMLEEVDKLSKHATDKVEQSPKDSLDAYTRLQAFTSALQPLQDAAEDAAPHLIDYVKNESDRTKSELSKTLWKNLEHVLKKLLWPKPGIKIPDGVQQEYREACENLLILQRPDLSSNRVTSQRYGNSRVVQIDVLLPLQVMVEPLETRFHYHFSGSKTTNRLDKPEYFLSHVQDLLTTYAPFMNDYLQSVLLRVFRSTDLVSDPNCIDATSAFITAVLPMVRNKVLALVPQVSSDPRLLSHLLNELMNFDEVLRDEWRYGVSNTRTGGSWKGLAGEVLAKDQWWDRWLQVEKDFALARYQSIIDDQDSSTLDFDGPETTATKPSKAAIRVNDLLETITDRYRRLASFSQKLRFLIDIQIAIFDQFHERLQSQLRAFEVGRYEAGANFRGIDGLDKLCRVFGSAAYLESAMRDWSDDVFFVELWNELQDRIRSQQQTSPTKGKLNITDIAARTSSTLRDDFDSDAINTASGALFDETASAYARLRARTEGILLDTLTSSFKKVMQPYAHSSPWSTRSVPSSASTSDTGAPQTSSVELNPVLEALNSHLDFLHSAVGTIPLRRLGSSIARNLDSYILNIVIMGNTFSYHGAQQVRIDTEVIATTLDRHIGGLVGSKGMRRCLEAAGLLALRDETEGSADEVEQAAESKTPDLQTVQQALQRSEEGAQMTLAEMGCQRLTVAEAKKVVVRRVEVDE